MMNNQWAWTRLGFGLLGGIVATLVVAGGPAWAQEKKDWEVLFAVGKDQKARAMQTIPLRPNTTQPMAVYLKNNGKNTRQDVIVKVVQIDGNDQEKVLAEAMLEKVGIKEPLLVKFKAGAPAKGEGPPKGEAPEPKLAGPPFTLQIQVWQKGAEKDKLTWKRDVPVTIQQPHEYVTADQPRFDKKTLSVGLTLEPNAGALPCEVKLVLDRDTIPELRSYDAVTEEKLTLETPKLVLHVANLEFAQGVPPKNGRVYLTIDGYERAYMFKSTFDQGNLRPLGDQTRVRLKAPRYFPLKADAKADPKVAAKLPLTLEVDGVLDQEVKVEVSFDRAGDGQFLKKDRYAGLRDQTLLVNVGKEGALQFVNTVKDWVVPLDTTGLRGKRLLRVRVLDANGKPKVLADESDLLSLFSRDPNNPFAPLSYDEDRTAVFAEIMVDPTGPELVRLDLPDDAVAGKTVQLKAVAKKRSPDQVPITKVQFFVGDPEKAPAIPGRFDKANDVWQAAWTVPKTAKEDDKWSVTVQFATATGMSAANTGELRLMKDDTPAATGGDKEILTKVTGTVMWASIPQPNLAVQLKDAKGAEVKSAKTNKDGFYVLDKVAPGSYTLSAAKTGFKGSKNISVPKGQKLLDEQDITLKRN